MRFKATCKKYDWHILAAFQTLLATSATIPSLVPDKDVKWVLFASALATFAYAVLKPKDPQDG